MKSSGLVAAIRYLGFTPRIDEFEWRLWIQKVAFILQVLGFQIDFSFIYYKRGPWSYDLNQEYCLDYKYAFEHLETKHILSEKEIQLVERLRNSVSLLDSQRLEGAASALYLVNGRADYDEDEVKKGLRAWKPDFSDERIALALDDAKKILYRDEYLTPALKKEFAAWQKLGMESTRMLAQTIKKCLKDSAKAIIARPGLSSASQSPLHPLPICASLVRELQ